MAVDDKHAEEVSAIIVCCIGSVFVT